MTRDPHGDERGLIVKAIAFTLIVLLVLGVAAADTGSILITRYNLQQLAGEAAFEGALAYRNTESRNAACDAAEAYVKADDPDVVLPDDFCEVDTGTRRVTITLKKTAGTLVAKHLQFLRKYTKIAATEESGALQ